MTATSTHAKWANRYAEALFNIGSKLTEGLLNMPESAIGPHVVRIVDEYYELMGWNMETGCPKAETIARLGMEESAQIKASAPPVISAEADATRSP